MGKKSSVGRVPKTKCCESRERCGRCPLRMLQEGTLPTQYAVRKRRLVHVGSLEPVTKDQLPKKGKKSEKKSKKGKRLPAAA